MINVIGVPMNIPGEYVGRPSVLGNPFAMGVHGDRTEVIAKYRVWLNDQLHDNEAVVAELQRLVLLAYEGDLNLICWCAPRPCHADVIKSCIEWLMSDFAPVIGEPS